ncbi:hypothetical protein KsCSTR_33400 [Candidatus Kuenenia stuttgartiensis]|uniref:Uncharacterized protein n=1 Tax=Kuenenia stuttgartiensis TaxID=174633 RepID=Q1Q4F8_KUEST|nr:MULTISPECIES: hypothetical protein [Kuenenia]MBE7547248.1 hypothetical protein [Planctomycetia bacterium]MBW7943080.1 hypothetical protein [Candidatus Kuenenia stuttgartiensis]MBZ0190341.1 hypothetical protein [Candidatus Kuenenia stuttgartiensis]MCF6152475.1 hypothetical protein [Candidatus Kuenenia stuttgartiensis]MCL4727295.1 hypothetical protein [Candidatus Kuenenia stuttgartiensis]
MPDSGKHTYKLRINIDAPKIALQESHVCGLVTVSMGIATTISDPDLNSDILIDYADKAYTRLKMKDVTGLKFFSAAIRRRLSILSVTSLYFQAKYLMVKSDNCEIRNKF